MVHKMSEVPCIVGASFSTLRPGASAAKSDILPDPLATDGMKANVNTTIPKPPNHCIILLQNKMPCVWESTSLRMVDPVVEKPDMVSKKASVTLSTAPLKRKGSMPKAENNSQERETMTKVSSASNIFFLLRPKKYSISPTVPVTAADTRKLFRSCSPRCLL